MVFDNSNIVDKDEIIIPNGTTVIDDCTGMGNKTVKRVVFPGSIELIRNRVFYECKNLETAVFEHNEVETPHCNGSGILQECPKLKDVYFADFETFDKYTCDMGGPLENGSRLHIGGELIENFIIPDSISSGRHNSIRNLIGAIGINSIAFKDDSIIGYHFEIRDRNGIRSEYGITKAKFEVILRQKYSRLGNFLITHFDNIEDFLNSRSIRYYHSIITTFDEFESIFKESMPPKRII